MYFHIWMNGLCEKSFGCYYDYSTNLISQVSEELDDVPMKWTHSVGGNSEVLQVLQEADVWRDAGQVVMA